MKKSFLYLMLISAFCSCTKDLVYNPQSSDEQMNKEDSRTVSLVEAGTLRDILSADVGMTLSSLTISGPINGSDLKYIREMAGADKEGKETNGKLVKLDLSQARFVKGGDTPFVYNGTPCQMKEDNTVPRYGFGYCKLKELKLPDNIVLFSDQAFFHCDSLRTINIPTSLQDMNYSVFCYCASLSSDLSFPETVTELGNFVFYGCHALKKVSLPNSITSIGDYCFVECFQLESFGTAFPNLKEIGEYAFYRCRKIQEMRLPHQMDIVPEGAFYGCSSLSSIDLSGKREVGKYAFYHCGKLTSTVFPNGLEIIGDSAFYDTGLSGSLVLPSTMKYVGDGAFYSTNISSLTINSDIRTNTTQGVYYSSAFRLCKNLKSVKISEGCTILDLSFSSCSALTEVSLPSTLDSIGCIVQYDYYDSGICHAFNNCPALTDIKLPPNLKYIGSYAFSNCTGITKMDIPETVKMIDVYAFKGCTGLANINLPASLKVISQGMLQNCTTLTDVKLPSAVSEIGYQAFDGTSITSIQLPESVTLIDDYAFRNCVSLKQINFPSALEEVGNDAFSGCVALSNITVADNCQLKEIGAMCFYKCTSLSSFEVPSLVTTIGNHAFSTSGISTVCISPSVVTIGDGCFSYCARLKTFVNLAPVPQQMVPSVFTGVNLGNVTLSVPAVSIDLYKNADVWKTFGTIQSF